MSELLSGVIGFAVLFALWGGYSLIRPRRSCSGGCGSCASAEACERAEREVGEQGGA